MVSFYKSHLFLLLEQENQLEKDCVRESEQLFGDTFPVSV